MKSLLVFVTLAVSVFGAPLGDPTAISQSGQGSSASGAVAAAANAGVNAAATVVDATVSGNNIADYSLNNLGVNVLRRQALDQAKQGADATGAVAAGANANANADVTGVDADVECNDILDDSLNNASVNILRRQAVSQSAQKGDASGLVAAAANAVANADVHGVDADVSGNNIADYSLNNAAVNILRRQAVSQSAQKGDASGLVAAAANAVANADVTGVDADVSGNNIADYSLNNLGVNVLKARDGLAAAQGEQGSQAQGGLLGLDANAIVNTVVDGVKAVVTNNHILDNDLNNLSVNVLRRDDVAASQSAQKSGAAGGLAGLDLNAVVNAVVKLVSAKVDGNNIADDTLNNASINVGQNLPIRRDGPLAVAQGLQGASAKGGLAGAAANIFGNAAVKGVDADVSGNNIADYTGNNAKVNILSPLPL